MYLMIGSVRRNGKYTDRSVEDASMTKVFAVLPDFPQAEWIPARISAVTEKRALNKYSIMRKTFNPAASMMAWDMMRREIAFLPKFAQSSFSEVVTEIDKTKSPGYPWNTMGFTTKGQVLEKYGEYLEWCYNGGQPESFWCIQLKNELRPVEKVEADKTRIFVISDVKHNIQVMRFTLKLATALTEAWKQWTSGVGASKYKGDWHFMVDDIAAFPNAFAADLSSCDMSVPFDWLRYFLLEFLPGFIVFNDNEEFEFYCDVMRAEIDKYIVTVTGDLLRSSDTIPSGSFLTIWLTVFYCRWMRYYAWVSLTELGGSTIYSYFRKNTRARHVGDDSLESSSDEILPVWNPKNISSVLNEHIEIVWSTDAPVPVVELDFCSQNTTYVDYMFFPYPRFRRWTGSAKWDYTDLTVPQKLAKLCALRTDNAFGPSFLWLERIVDAYIHEWDSKFPPGHKEWNDAKRQKFDRRELTQLYTGKKYEFL